MRARVLLVGVLLVLAPVSGRTDRDAVPRTGARTLVELAAVYGDDFRVDPPPSGLSPEARADWVLTERPALGRTPQEWIDWSRSEFRLDRPARVSSRTNPVAEIVRLYDAVGVPAAFAGRAELPLLARGIPPEVRAPFAELIGVVADVYEAQVPVARAIVERARRAFDPRRQVMIPAEREHTAAAQSRIIGAINAFRSSTAGFFASHPSVARDGSDPPLFSDPEGLVILGGPGDGTYTRSGVFPDPVLVVDPSGNDTYENSAGGACPVDLWFDCNSLVVSVVADLGDDGAISSDDVYRYDGPPAAVQGAGGLGGLGVLVDVAGNDRYTAKMTRGTVGPFFQYIDGGAQGFGFAGNGVQLDGFGNDLYRLDVLSSAGRDIWAFAQGFGGAGGLGISSDFAGNDAWISEGLGLVGRGFEGVYNAGVGFYGGVGIMTDAGAGSDIYKSVINAQTVDLYSIGFGAFGGLGILYEDGGDDNYYTYQHGTNPFINPLLNCAYGTASLGGVGVMLDVAGNDVYYGESVSPRGASVMDSGFGGPGAAYGLFMDTGGNDRYVMAADGSSTMIEGRGLFQANGLHNTWGTFVDIGGTDTYVGGHGANNTQWAFGVDRGVDES